MEEEYPSIPMGRTRKILRTSIHTFLKNYQYFTITSSLLSLPFSASVLLSQTFVPFSPLLPTIYHRLRSLFDAASFPPSSQFFTILNLKLSQTITSSILVLPFTLSFLLFAKASVIQALHHHKPPLRHSLASFISIYNPILLTQICNSIVILSANATCFSLLFLAFNFLEGFGFSSPNSLLFLSATGAVMYSVILANAFIICNLALVLSGVDKCGGFQAILKACVLIRGRTATALALALPANMALAAIEALFQYRVVRAYYFTKSSNSSTALEGMFIAYLYSIIVVIDTIVTYVFFKSCKSAYRDIISSVENVKSLDDIP
ncbi:hypothetical protein HYC85_004886 [Camellia sinensis]|uniref:Uncharacterized protein n=1 Tax=Camellia sinensis TaxID=4442 RepID=A0A7J7HZG1_CAMSI|nr:hypothetical protein HYC85_004886 [Camellia sinensis]